MSIDLSTGKHVSNRLLNGLVEVAVLELLDGAMPKVEEVDYIYELKHVFGILTEGLSNGEYCDETEYTMEEIQDILEEIKPTVEVFYQKVSDAYRSMHEKIVEAKYPKEPEEKIEFRKP